MKLRRRAMQGDFRFDITWTTLAEYLRLLERRGVAPNVASFVGTGTIREHVVGLDDGRPTPAQLDAMRDLVRREMEAGALGHRLVAHLRAGRVQLARRTSSSSRRSRRATGASTSPTCAARATGSSRRWTRRSASRARRGSRPRSTTSRPAARRTGRSSTRAIEKVEAARREGLKITADMYTYTAGATGFDACLPPWSREGGWGKTLRAHPRRADARADPEGDARAGRRLGEPVPPGRLARAHPARGLPERGPEAAHRARRSPRSRRRGAAAPRTRSSTSWSRTSRGSASCSS